MKSLIATDLHLGIQKNDIIWLEQSKKLIMAIIDECHRRDVFNLCILGDLFHDRKAVGVKTLLTAFEIADLLKDAGIKVTLLVGNHDTFNKNEQDTHILKIFTEYDNIEVIENHKIVENVAFVSWEGTIPKNVDYVFGHFEINGFPVTNNLVFEKSKLNFDSFHEYKQIISGHFHIPSKRNNITYLGAPYPLTFNDVGSVRGFYYFDNDVLEFIEFDGIKFFNISSEEALNPRKITGNIVKLIFEKDYGTVENNKKIEAIQSYNPLRLQTDFTKFTSEIKMDITDAAVELKDNRQILLDYMRIAEIPEYLDTKRLESIVEILMGEK